MTTNTNPSRTTARFFASATPVSVGRYSITDRADGIIVAYVTGRAAARTMAATLTAIDPADRVIETKATKKAKAKAEPKPTAHTACEHAATKLARAICRRERSKADAPAEATKADA